MTFATKFHGILSFIILINQEVIIKFFYDMIINYFYIYSHLFKNFLNFFYLLIFLNKFSEYSKNYKLIVQKPPQI